MCIVSNLIHLCGKKNFNISLIIIFEKSKHRISAFIGIIHYII